MTSKAAEAILNTCLKMKDKNRLETEFYLIEFKNGQFLDVSTLERVRSYEYDSINKIYRIKNQDGVAIEEILPDILITEEDMEKLILDFFEEMQLYTLRREDGAFNETFFYYQNGELHETKVFPDEAAIENGVAIYFAFINEIDQVYIKKIKEVKH